ncbi:Signal peptidase I [Arcticibacter svalbardensis MN12-7]|uniref:Signal peptidase I n=1 Tax=Arcticibacter svalbardensis MN12-7 TaxID=1150600 RepID=R9GRS3_9SPHI|nr:signal peptidase I [Arcticibacter svalbardensis]EOR94230.1 Signal peptidase I [Arcticibacter svalbardensis MN12-7]
MESTGIWLVIGILTISTLVGMWMLFEKANRKGWEALIPVYNMIVVLKITGRPLWWIILLLIPVINLIVALGLIVDFAKSYGKTSFPEHAGAVLFPFIIFPYWGFDANTKYLGQSATEEFHVKYPYRKSAAREWGDAIIFAVVAATLIRSFLLEAYTIPTGSMEKSLLIGDFLFVSKVNYGARIPMTPIAFPFAHHTMPLIGTKAYWDGLELKYRRLPALEEIERNDVVVFNYPMEADAPFNRPVDKRENYIKRCIAICGDTLRIINAQVYVNSKKAINLEFAQKYNAVVSDGTDFNPQKLTDMNIDAQRRSDVDYLFNMTKGQALEIKSWANVKEVKPYIQSASMYDTEIFPKDPAFRWNVDNFGPLIIPKKGWTVKLDSTNIPLYKRAIEVYEGNKVEVINHNQISINGKLANSYTFKMNYYWMMGDNRDNSLDSRFWGFVPEDHIVGKALFVWMSWNTNGSFLSKIRWDRLFMGIK